MPNYEMKGGTGAPEQIQYNAALGFSVGRSAISSIDNYLSSSSKSKSVGEANRANIGHARDEYITRSNIAREQEESIDRELGDILSRNGIEAMKAESRLRAAGASTGVSGSSIEETVNQSGYDQILDNQINIARSRTQKIDTFRSRLQAKMDFNSKTNSAINSSENLVNPKSEVILSAISSGLQAKVNYDKYKDDK